MPLFRPAGRHVKPSIFPKAALAGGLTAAVLLGDAGAASASAPSSEWDRLARCEAGGNWSINTGNGYYGGLQFNLATWRSVGGSGRPDQASRSEQIRRANALHDSRGFSPWPSCSRKLGLRSGPADVEPVAQAAQRGGERASRSRRVALVGVKATTARRARVVALATVAPPRFDGRIMRASDAGVYRMSTKMWQRRMAARGWAIAADGRFGPQSAGVARAFAQQQGLTPARPGTVDRAVWNAAWSTAG